MSEDIICNISSNKKSNEKIVGSDNIQSNRSWNNSIFDDSHDHASSDIDGFKHKELNTTHSLESQSTISSKYSDTKQNDSFLSVSMSTSSHVIVAPPVTTEEMILSPQNLRNRQSTPSCYNSSLHSNNNNNNQILIAMTTTAATPGELDPLSLLQILKTEEELDDIEKNGGTKKLIKFYKLQNELIKELITPLAPMDENEKRKENFKLKIAIYGSTIINVILFCIQLTAALLSGSLSLFATTADAFMDIFSSAILLITTYLSGKKEIYRYPAGKGRFETAGIIVFASLMATLSLQLIIQAGTSLTGHPESPDLGIISISFVCIVLVCKLCLYLYCRHLTKQPAAQILSQDHRNDLFVNSFGLTLGILGDRVNALIDPIGAIIVALIILKSWSWTVLEQCQLIVGKSGDPIFLKKVIYISMTHDERILQVDTCRVYHAGSKVTVEVDIVLSPETSLQVSHDVGETLQIKLESLPNVDRAFVHCDYEATHTPEHQKWV